MRKLLTIIIAIIMLTSTNAWALKPMQDLHRDYPNVFPRRMTDEQVDAWKRSGVGQVHKGGAWSTYSKNQKQYKPRSN